MPVEIIPAVFCGGYWADYEVPGSAPGSRYRVSLMGGEGPSHCPCPSFKFAPADKKTCKHVEHVWKHACLWNPQWHDGGPGTLKPVGYLRPGVPDQACPKCGGPVVAVRIAV